jgi:hypothetical protein
MQKPLTLVLLAGVALMLAAMPARAQTYQDYASGQAYVMTSPVAAYTPTPTPPPAPTYQDYASGRAYVMTSPVGGPTAPRNIEYPAYPVIAVPIPYYGYADPRWTPGWPTPPASITETIARSRFQPSLGTIYSTTPRMQSWTPSPYFNHTWAQGWQR